MNSSMMLRRWLLCLVLIGSGLLGGCASVYLDSGVREVPPHEMRRPANPAQVQLLFEFQTRGVANAGATKHLSPQVLDQVKSSGLFTQVSDVYAPGMGVLSLSINNVPMSDDAFSKGFLTGLTLGLAGSQVGDGYVCTATYTPPGGGATTTKRARHAIYTTVGATSGPSNGVKMASIQEAVTTMVRQVVSQTLSELSSDPKFSQ